MKKFLFLCLAVSCFLVCSCSMLEALNTEDRSSVLNYYNSHWDHFTGALELGKNYTYSNSKYDSRLRFTALQCLENKRSLFARPKTRDYLYGDYQDICDEAIILVLSDRSYADGATLQDGTYKCISTYTYKTVENHTKTVYVLKEIKQDNK